jgi:hypothetical protein
MVDPVDAFRVAIGNVRAGTIPGTSTRGFIMDDDIFVYGDNGEIMGIKVGDAVMVGGTMVGSLGQLTIVSAEYRRTCPNCEWLNVDTAAVCRRCEMELV